MNVFKQLKIAIANVKDYNLLIGLKVRSFVLYFLMLVLINVLGICAMLLPIYAMGGGIANTVEKYVPDFSFENGKLKTDKVHFTDDDSSVCIYIDTDSNELAMNMGRGYKLVLIASSDELYICDGVNESKIPAKDFDGINKAEILKLVSDKSVVTSVVIGGVIGLFITIAISLLAQCVFFACIVSLCNSISIRARVKFWNIVRICCYAYTLPMLLNMALMFFGFTAFKGYTSIIVFVYTYFALKEIKKGDGIVIAALDE